MDLEQLLALIANLATMTDDEIATLVTDLEAHINPLLDADPTDENLALLTRVSEALASIADVQAARETETADRQARRQALADQIRSQLPTGSDTGGDGGDGGAGDGTGDGGEGDGAGEGGELVPGAGDGEGANTEGAGAPVPVAAGAGTTPPVRVTRVAARRPAAVQPNPSSQPERRLSLVAAGTWDGISAGDPIDTPEDIATAFLAAARATQGYKGPRMKIPVVRTVIGDEVWGDRWLGRDAIENERRLRSHIGRPGSLTAAGGICAPQQVNYDLPTWGTDARPVRDTALARFGADRGGIRTLPLVTLGDVEDAISVWTHATDLNPGDETKPCLTIVCDDDESESLVDAIVRCLRTGNFRARFFPEQIRAWTDLAAVWQARFAETRLLTAMGAASTQVTTDRVLGTSRDMLSFLDRALAGFQSRWRDDNIAMRWVAPAWLLRNMATDIARQMPVGTLDETLAVAEADIQRWFDARPNLRTTWHLDGEAGQIFGEQGDGDLNGWPANVIHYLYPEGSHLFLDGGELNLGIVRDSTLNSVNDFQMFAETFEGHHFRGLESLRIDSDICADGSASALVDIDPCTSGS